MKRTSSCPASTDHMVESPLYKGWQSATQYLSNTGQAGWWPYRDGQNPAAEATAWCGIALRNNHEIALKVLNHFASTQNADGGWSTEPGAGASDWCTAPVVLALGILLSGTPINNKQALKQIRQAYIRGTNFLADHQSEIYSLPIRLAYFVLKGPSALNHFQGWPWTPGCAHWVEPTSYALMALKQARIPHSESVKTAIKNAEKYLLEHACQNGGWNHGNNECLGVHLPPYPVTTSEAIIALQDLADHPKLKKGMVYLEQVANQQESIMSLSWLILAYSAIRQTESSQLAKLLSFQLPNGSFGENYLLSGLACLAISLTVGKNPLKFSSGIPHD